MEHGRLDFLFHLCKTAPKSDMIVLVATFFLTVFFDLVVAIEVGVVLAALLFMKRMAETADVTAWKYADEPDVTPGEAEKCATFRTRSVYLRSVDRCFSPLLTKFLQLPVTSQPKSSLSVCEVFRQLMPAQCVPCVILLPARRKTYHFDLLTCQRTADVRYEKDHFIELIGEEHFLPNIVEALGYAENMVADSGHKAAK